MNVFKDEDADLVSNYLVIICIFKGIFFPPSSQKHPRYTTLLPTDHLPVVLARTADTSAGRGTQRASAQCHGVFLALGRQAGLSQMAPAAAA